MLDYLIINFSLLIFHCDEYQHISKSAHQHIKKSLHFLWNFTVFCVHYNTALCKVSVELVQDSMMSRGRANFVSDERSAAKSRKAGAHFADVAGSYGEKMQHEAWKGD